jgi:glycosyltransferase involved in cell wall biosynthesis
MITIGYSTRASNPTFIDQIKKTVGIKDVEIIEVINNGEKSLTKVYNEILNQAKNDIVVLCHDDILFETKSWGKRILEHFEKTDYGILGVAGTTHMPSSGMWWEVKSEMIGQVYHMNEGEKWLSEYNKPFGSRIIQSVVVDGLFIALHKNRINNNFIEDFDGFHFYDISFCLSNFLSGVKIGTISNVRLTHLSIGMTNENWDKNRLFLIEKYGANLPIKLESIYPVYNLNQTQPIVSIIIPIYNYGLQFEKTLQSVFESTYKNIEIIIVNDGSTDLYVKLKLDSIKNHPNIKIINQENQGPSSARNNGVRSSIGQYILPLDADDMLLPEYIDTCVKILNKNKKISPVYCDTIHVGEIQGVEKRPEWAMDTLKAGPFIVNCSMFHRDAFDACNGFDETLKGWEDYDFWIRMGLNGYTGKRIQKPMFVYFHHESTGTVSTEANKNRQELYNKIITKNFKNEIV